MKFNAKVGRDRSTGPMVLSNDDILAVVKILVELRNGRGEVDDIDHLGNRRVRCVGELAENQYRMGLAHREGREGAPGPGRARTADAARPDQLQADLRGPEGVLRCLAAVAVHGPDQPAGRDHAQAPRFGPGPGRPDARARRLRVRDVHVTHYGRVCPIETPEGPNIGLINSLALYARLNEYGFIETPYRRVVDGKVTNEIDYLSAIEEGKYIIAQANATLDKDGRLTGDLVSAREGRSVPWWAPSASSTWTCRRADRVGGRLAGAFLEHDANRALMGANMSRQAGAVLRPESRVAPASSAWPPSTRAPWSRRAAAAWWTTSTPRAS
jgi:DNA-directed RNA polymerase subunit beta